MEVSQFREIDELCFSNSQWPLNSYGFEDELLMNSVNMEAALLAFGEQELTYDDHNHHLYAHDHDASLMFNQAETVMEPSPRPFKQLKTSSSSNSSWNNSSSCISTSHHQSLMNHNQNLHYAAASIPKEEVGTHVSSKTKNGSFTHYDIQFAGSQNHMTSSSSKISTAAVPHQAGHHILAERKRREKLSQRFIALSALIPGLKKMDKASVLGDAIKHLKNLQEKLKALEEKAKNKSSTESVVFVKRYEVLVDAAGGEILSSSTDDAHNSSVHHDQLPEVEARFSGKDVLIRVHCENKAGVVQETLAHIQKLHLSVINTTTITFATYALDITIVAQMDQDFTMTMKDLVKNLRTGLK